MAHRGHHSAQELDSDPIVSSGSDAPGGTCPVELAPCHRDNGIYSIVTLSSCVTTAPRARVGCHSARPTSTKRAALPSCPRNATQIRSLIDCDILYARYCTSTVLPDVRRLGVDLDDRFTTSSDIVPWKAGQKIGNKKANFTSDRRVRRPN